MAGRLALLSVTLALSCVTCGAAGPSGLQRVPEGQWGGDHVGLDVTAQGGRVDYDCAHGTIEESMKLDKDGRFNVKGTHVRERPGPVREGQDPDARPARYEGKTDGRTLTLNVSLSDTKESVGAFTLTYRQAPRVTKCL